MKKIILCFALLLAACTAFEPKIFDVPQSQWVQMTPEQQQEVIRGYNERKKMEQANEMIQSTIKTAGEVIQQANK